MNFASIANAATWSIAAIATAGVIIRPWNVSEAIWAVLGAFALIVLGLIAPAQAITAVGRGGDVYLFLIGMMVLAELARKNGLFDWLAAYAVRAAAGSAEKLFALIYAVGIAVTVLLSNDATAVVLTPAVYAAAKAAGAKPLPYLYICAFIANAASFVLPISNPANLVIFRENMPPLASWLARFTVPSLIAIAVTFAALRYTQRAALRQPITSDIAMPVLPRGGFMTACGIAVTAVALLAASARGLDLGLPTFVAGIITMAAVLLSQRQSPWPILRDVSWGVIALVAGLFIIVEALDSTGLVAALAKYLRDAADVSVSGAVWQSGIAVALASNLMNNLPAGLLAGSAVHAAHVPEAVSSAVLIGVDLGPNLSVTGSLATILWLVALRRDGEDVSAAQFLRVGIVVMTPALLLTLWSLTQIY